MSGGRVLKLIFKLVSHVYHLNSGILGGSRESLSKSMTGDINFLTLGLELDKINTSDLRCGADDFF